MLSAKRGRLVRGQNIGKNEEIMNSVVLCCVSLKISEIQVGSGPLVLEFGIPGRNSSWKN